MGGHLRFFHLAEATGRPEAAAALVTPALETVDGRPIWRIDSAESGD
jgi:hypothetical protein